MSPVTLETIRDLDFTEIADFSPEELFAVRLEATTLLTAVKQLVDKIDQALERKYAEPAQILRRAQGKDTGVVHFDDGTVRITAELPKKVEWDQQQLAAIVHKIAASGDNPAAYVETTYRVSETHYHAWDAPIQRVFTPARTVKTGKASFRLALMSAGGAK